MPTFSGDIDLLVSPITFQDYMVDKETGAPLSGGIVTCYEDLAQSVLKNWYFQSGTTPPYTYVTLPNPLTLSAVGTIDTGSGSDVLPFFYPYEESSSTPKDHKRPYYITVDSAGGTRQFVRHNFPFGGSPVPPTNANPTFRNYIVNNNFWRNIQTYGPGPNFSPNPIDLSSETNLVLAPSQHDGFQYPDFRFRKDATGSTEEAIFQKFLFGSNPLKNGEVTPEFYMNHTCTVAGSEAYKYYSFPISYHIKTLDAVSVTVTIQAQQGSVSADNIIKLYFLQDWGTGATSPAPILIGTATCTAAWTKYSFPVTTPSCLGATISPTGDDALYLLISIPVSATFNINFTLPSLYIGAESATNDFVTYDQTDAIINSPRTGDHRPTLNDFQPGWVPANDGTIGTNSSIATTRANIDTWPLYNLIWNKISRVWSPLSTVTAGTAEADFAAGTTLALTKNLGRVLAGQDPVFITPSAFTSTVSTLNVISVSTGTNEFELASAFTFSTGQPIQFNSTGVLPSAVTPIVSNNITGVMLSTSTIYYAIFVDTTHIKLAYTLKDAVNGTFMTITAAGTQPNTIVNTNNVLTLGTSQSPFLKAGSPVVFSNTGGALPLGLSAAAVYYITTTSLAATTITVNDNLTDAMAGYFLPVLSTSTGVSTVSNALGSYNGTGYTTDVPMHSHIQDPRTMTSDGNDYSGGSGRGSPGATLSTDYTGIEKVSLIQPTSYMNVYIKL